MREVREEGCRKGEMSIVGKGEGAVAAAVEDIGVGDWFARILTVFEMVFF